MSAVLATSKQKAILLGPIKKPIISIKEARKILGKSFEDMTNEELLDLIDQNEQIIRVILKLRKVHNITVVS